MSLKLAACLQYLNKQQEAKAIIDSIKETHARELPPVLILEAIDFSGEKNHTQALDLFLAAEKDIKHLPQLYTMIGNEYALLKNWTLAETYYKKTLALQANDTKALINLEYVLKQQQKSTTEFDALLTKLTKKQIVDFINTYDGLNELDFNTDRVIDFRKYQLIIRLFLEQFHKGVKQLK